MCPLDRYTAAILLIDGSRGVAPEVASSGAEREKSPENLRPTSRREQGRENVKEES